MRFPSDLSCNFLFALAFVSLLLGAIASPIIGGEQPWATLSEPEYLAYVPPDAANNLPDPSTPDTVGDWSSLTALWNNFQPENTATEVVVPQQENIPYLITDGMVQGTTSAPKPRGRPTPIHPELPEWDFRKYPGYPSEDSQALYNPKTGIYWAQKKLSCSGGRQLFCCRPEDIKCCTCELFFCLFFSLFCFLFGGGKQPGK